MSVDEPWPEEGLEYLGHCPVCRSEGRTLLYADLTDRVFQVARGRWTMYRCSACQSAYLDPRATPATIGAAYSGYSQDSGEAPRTLRSAVVGFARRLMSGHLNSKYGYDFEPSLKAGRVILPLLPGIRGMAERHVRSLPLVSQQARLLDLGCGTGDFLMTMRDGGWNVEGIEPDEQSVRQAHDRGLDVRPGVLTEENAPAELYDAITLSHVLEHLHEPTSTLRACFHALKPGGVIWIATPNIEAQGHRSFGRHWVGLDPPRHLAIVNSASLDRALVAAGFEWPTRPSFVPQALPFTFGVSEATRAGAASAYRSAPSLRGSSRARAFAADVKALVWRTYAEELVVLARRPESPSG